MTREMSLIVLGLAVMVTPYLGFPSAWRTALLVLCGAAVAVIGFLLRGQALSRPQEMTEHQPFQESARSMDGMRAEQPVSDLQ